MHDMMTIVKSYIENLFLAKGISISNNRIQLFEEFIQNTINQQVVSTIVEQQQYLMGVWKIKNRIADIIDLHVPVPNATAGKPYEAKIDLEQLGLQDIVSTTWQGLEEIGLQFNKDSDTIEGTPVQSGEFKVRLLFKIEEDADEESIKTLSLIVNADPKTLWKNLPSDPEAIFWKEDDVSAFAPLGEKHIVAASNRGRSHENVGSFRDDDFAFRHLEKTGWSVVAVADGAGSYYLSRKGAQLACHSVVNYFENHLEQGAFHLLEDQLIAYEKSKDENLFKDAEILSKQNLYKAVLFVHNQIKALAEETQRSNPELFVSSKAKAPADYFHATLIFALFKKFDFGYVIMTFGVGDCPIAVMNREQSGTTLLNWLDVGEFGGGTRFVTQPDIFHSKEHPMASRFNLKIIPDFSYLFLMTDGIYDPKFVVEANLEKHEKWVEFVADLQGKNENNARVDFSAANEEIAGQLTAWMDFWSTGNHDDRTLAIIF